MRNGFLLFIFLILFSSFSKPESAYPIHSDLKSISISFPAKEMLTLENFITLKIREIEKLTGKKLTLKEKIVVKIIQLKLKKKLKSDEPKSSKGSTALFLGILALVLLVIPYAVLASLPLAIIAIIMGSKAVKENPADKKGKTAKLLGWIAIGLFFLFLIIALAVIAAWTLSWG